MVEAHESLALAITASDLIYVGGSVLQSDGGPKAWSFVQWGTMVAFEARKHLGAVHGIRLALTWEDEIAAAARHGAKYFDGKASRIDAVVADFGRLAAATHESFYPPNRLGGALFDGLRDDLSVVRVGSDVVLTNVTGHFMVGLSPERAARLEAIGDHVLKLSRGIGELTHGLTQARVDDLRPHGSAIDVDTTFWDGKMRQAIPNAFAGELKEDLAFALISILATVQSAARWAWADCCRSCAAASLKHRFVVSHHAAQSIATLAERSSNLGPVARDRLTALAARDDARTIVSPDMRRLRNGWLHLGMGDVAPKVSPDDLLSPVSAYATADIEAFSRLVERYLVALAADLNEWLLTPPAGGSSFLTHLRPAPE